MAEYTKLLHIRKDSVITDIKLYTTTDEVGTNYITLKDGTTPIYAKLGDITDANASALRVRKSSTVYAVLTQAAPAIPTGLYIHPGALGTSTFTWIPPTGITVVLVQFGRGGEGGVQTGSPSIYVGVTPNKSYTWGYSASLSGGVPGTSGTAVDDNNSTFILTMSGIGPGYGGLDVVINWSPDINNVAPSKTYY